MFVLTLAAALFYAFPHHIFRSFQLSYVCLLLADVVAEKKLFVFMINGKKFLPVAIPAPASKKQRQKIGANEHKQSTLCKGRRFFYSFRFLGIWETRRPQTAAATTKKSSA